MEYLSVFNEERLKEIVYESVQKCIDERIMRSLEGAKSEEDGFYSRDEICELLHIAYPTLWRMEKAGVLTSQKVGRKNLYSKHEVNMLVKSGKLAKYSHRK